MKKIFSLIIAIFAIISFANADSYRILDQTDNSITVQRTYASTETAQYQRVDNGSSDNSYYNTQYKPGNVGIAAHIGYGFGTNNPASHYGTEIGGQIYYNFTAKDKVKFGISIGFDYGVSQWWKSHYSEDYACPYNTNGFNSKRLYWDVRAGIIICKYLGIGGIYGKYNMVTGPDYTINQVNDGGVYGTIYLPFCKWFGLNIDAKWTKCQGATIGGGIIIQMNVKQ